MGNTIGIIGLAFGKHKKEAGPSNEEVAAVVEDIVGFDEPDSITSVQGEVEAAMHWSPDFVISRFDEYISTKEAIERSLDKFQANSVHTVILVAHPLHLKVIRLLLKTKVWRFIGFTFPSTYDKHMRIIPYDRSEGNTQEWTRGPIPFMFYMVKVLFTGKHGT